MKTRVKFQNNNQKVFLNQCIKNLNITSLRELLKLGLNTNYTSLKNYHTNRRLMPKDLFLDLCHLAKINPNHLNTTYLEENWGQVKGGKKSKRK